MYYLLLVLSFSEVLVLFASAIGLFVFVLRETVRAIDDLLEAAINVRWPGAQSGVKAQGLLCVGFKSRLRMIPGGHNEHF